jgi:hypothetical protein
MNEAAAVPDAYLPPLLQLLVVCVAIAGALLHLGLTVYAAFRAWSKLPGPQATLITIACLFCPLPFIGPIILLVVINKLGRQPQST